MIENRKAGNEPVGFIGVRTRGHQNIRYRELLPRLSSAKGYYYWIPASGRARRVLRWLGMEFPFGSRVLRHIAKHHDVLLATDSGPITWADLVRRFQGPVIVDLDDPGELEDEVPTLNRPNVIAVVTTTEMLRRTLIEAGVRTSIHVVPQAVPDAWLEVDRQESGLIVGVAQARLSLSNDNYSVNAVVEAVAASRATIPGVRLELVGRATPGLERYVKDTSWISLRGYVRHERLPLVMRRWAIAAYPRPLDWSGRLSIKLLEYMALGLPVLGTSVSEMRAIAHSGAVLQASTALEWTQQLDRLCQDPALRSRLGLAGRAFAQRFAVSRVAAEYDEVLRSIMAGHHASSTRPPSAPM